MVLLTTIIYVPEQESLRMDNRPGWILRDWLEAPRSSAEPPSQPIRGLLLPYRALEDGFSGLQDSDYFYYVADLLSRALVDASAPIS